MEIADQTMHERIELALAQDRINHAKQKIFHFIVRSGFLLIILLTYVLLTKVLLLRNVRRRLFTKRLFGAVKTVRMEKASEESAIQKRARAMELNGAHV